MHRTLLRLRSTVCRPISEITLADSRGRYLYLIAATPPAAIAVPLELDQVRQLVFSMSAWLEEHPAEVRPYGRTVQTCTVASGAAPV